MAKGPVKYTDLFASDVHYGLIELEEDFKKLDSVAQSFSKTITGTKARIRVTIDQQKVALKDHEKALIGTDVAGKNAAATIEKISKAVEANIKKTQILNAQQEILNKTFHASTASVDQIKDKIAQLTTQYNALGRATDQDKAKSSALAAEIRKLKGEQESLTGALLKGKKAVEAAEGSYNQMSRKLADLRKELREMPGAVNKTTGEWNKANPAVARHLAQIEKLDRGIKKMDATLGQHQRHVGDYSGALNKAGAEITSFLAGFISVAGAMTVASAAFDKALEVDSIKTALEFIFRGTGDATERIQMLKDTAERLGLEFATLAGSYKSFAGAAVASNFPLKEADRLFQSVANASAKLKLSSEQTEGALNALQQMISKGNVQAEELRGQLGERIPGAFSIAARAMGVTEQQLNKLLKDGEVLASDLLPKLATELDKTFDNNNDEKVDSLQSSVNRLKNTFALAVEEGNVSAFFKVFVDGVQLAASSLNKLVNSSSWKEFFARTIASAAGEGSIGGIVGGVLGDAFAMEEEISRMTDLDKVISSFRKKSQAEQLASIKAYAAARTKALDSAKTKEELIYANSLTDTLNKLSKIYHELNKAKVEGGETESERAKREKAEKKALADAARAARRAEIDRKRALKEADDLLKAQTKIKLAALDLALTNDLSNATEADKTKILIKYENDKLSIIQSGVVDRKKLYSKGSTDFVELEAEKVKAATEAQEAINKATEDGLKRQKALQDKYASLDNELLTVQDQGAQDQAVSAVNNKQFRGTPQEQERQKQDAIYEIKKQGLIQDLLLADLGFSHVQDRLEREKLIEIEKAKIVNQLNELNASQSEKLKDRAKENLSEIFSFLHSNSQLIGNLFGTELGNLFTNLTTDLHAFLDGGKQGFEEWAQIAISAINAVTESMAIASEAKIANLEKDRDREIELAGQNAHAKQLIEDEYNKRVKEEKKKQARANKAAALVEIAINTYLAASKVLGQTGLFGIPLVPVIIGLGAVQAALVAAQPIPEFWKGTLNAPKGPAQISERGPEIIEDTSGKRRLIKDHSIINLKGGEKIFTADQTSKMLQDMDVNQSADLHADLSRSVTIGKRNEEIQVMAAALQMNRMDEKKIGEEVGKRIAEIPMNNWTVDERGFTRGIRKNNSTVTQINDKYKLK